MGSGRFFNRFPLEKKREKIDVNPHHQNVQSAKEIPHLAVYASVSAFRASRFPPATKLVAVMSSKYTTVDETQATSLAEAKILAKQHEGLHWKVHRKNPGVTGTTAIFQCNSHVHCPRLLRVACIQGVYYLQVKGGDHSTEVNLQYMPARTHRVHSTSRRGCVLGWMLVASLEVSMQP